MPFPSNALPRAMRTFWEQQMRPFWERLVAPHPDLTDFGDQLRARVLSTLSLLLLGIYFLPEMIHLLTEPSTAELPTLYILLTALSIVVAYGLSRTRRLWWGAWVLLLTLMAGPSVGLFAAPEVTATILYHNVNWGLLALVISALLMPTGQFVLFAVLGTASIAAAAHLRGVPDDWLVQPLIVFGLMALVLLTLVRSRRHFMERITESERRFRDLFNSTLEALVIHDGRRILAVNPAFEETFHCRAEEVIGRSPLALVAPEDRENFQASLHAPRARLRATAQRPDGSTFVAEALSASVAYQGRQAFALGIRDVTEQVRTTEALQRERNFLQHILESIDDPFYVLDAQTFEIVVANSAARAKGNPSATTCYALSHRRETPCSGLEHPCPLQQVMRTNEPFTVEHTHYHADGTPYFVEVHGYPIFDEQGRVVQMVEYAVDITARKQAEEQIRKLQQAVEQSANAIVITNREGTIEYVNPAFTRMTGYAPEEAIGQNPRILKSGYHSAEFYAHMWETLLRGEIWQGEMRNKRKDGSLYWEEQTITPVVDDQGRITHYIAIKVDITARKAMEEDLRRAHEQALEANRLKTSLLANVSHDMRTPLGGILGFAEMLQSGVLGPLNEEQRQALQHILSSTQTLVDFTNDLINQAELESGRLRLNIQPFEPQDLLKVLSSYVGLAQTKGVQLHTEVDPAIPSPIYGDLYWIRRILANLLSNAVKFTEKGHIWIRLLAWEGDRWAIQVKDTGPGIPPDKQAHIFEPFRQVEEGPTRRHKGSGLGLSIVKQLVELMHGEIQLQSTPGKGSTFTVILPCQARHASQEERP